MRHRVYGKHLGRNKDERSTLFKGLLSSLFTYGSIQTSETKAKAIKGLVDKVVNLAKEKKGQLRLQSFITDKDLAERLIKEIVPKIGNRNSGYTSLVKLGNRYGDQTMMVRMSLIGAEKLKPIEKESRVKSLESSEKTVKTETKKTARKVKQPIKVVKKKGKKS